MRPKRIHSPKELGASLISVLVAFSILGILASVLSTSFRNNVSSVSKINKKQDVEGLRRLLRIGTNCAFTVNKKPTKCKNGDALVLWKGASTPSILVGTPFTTIGDYDVRAKCTKVPHEILVQYRVQKQKWQALFPNDLPMSCRGD